MTIQNMAEAETALQPYVPLISQLLGKSLTLERVVPLMKLVGSPEKRLKIIHIAGTSGKTSTAYYMSAFLSASDFKVGLTVSPHLDSLTERVQINGKPLSEAKFCSELGKFMELIEQAAQPPTYFELLYAFAIWVFDRQAVDYAVIETGVGGLNDATNIAQRPDKVCIITDIGYDHTAILGNTLSEIATQKIGIVHPGNQVFTYDQAPEIMAVFKNWVSSHSAKLHITTEEGETKSAHKDLSELPAYQKRNWLLAYAVYRYIKKRDGLPSLTSQSLNEVQRIVIPGRLEVRHLNNKIIIMDGAHNSQKVRAFVISFKELYPSTEPVVLLALKEGKDYQSVVPILAKLTQHFIVTKFETTQDLPTKSIDPNILGEALKNAGVSNVKVIPDQHLAYQTLLEVNEPIIIITGSFYLLSQLRRNEGLA